MQSKTHVSPSQLDMLSRCGIQWEFRYAKGLIIPPGVAMLKGTCMHEAAGTNGRQKIESHKDISVSDCKEAAAAKFEEQIKGDGVWLNPEESDRGSKVVLGEAKDEAVSMAGYYGKHIAPDYQPTHVEERFRIELPGTHDLLGIIDLIDDCKRVIDYKTSGRSKRQEDADKSVQLSAYAAGHRQLTGEDPEELRLDVVVQQKSGTKRQVITTHRDEHDDKVLAARIDAASKQIESGNFVPAAPDAWCCSPKWCGWYDRCPYVRGR